MSTDSHQKIEEEKSIESINSEFCREELEAMDDENFEGLSNTCLLISSKIVENCGGTMTVYKSSQRDQFLQDVKTHNYAFTMPMKVSNDEPGQDQQVSTPSRQFSICSPSNQSNTHRSD